MLHIKRRVFYYLLAAWLILAQVIPALAGQLAGEGPGQSGPLTSSAGTDLFLPLIRAAGFNNTGGSGGDGYITRDTKNWAMAAADPARTSWTSEEVRDQISAVTGGNLNIIWYRPIEAFIPQNAQLIASNGYIYVSTARGLYALRADNGDVAWRFDSELPMGNSPTVSDGVVYVGGFDKQLHALKADTGASLWSFDEAQAGYSANPLVIDGRVLVGNRDGYFYAIGAQGSPQQGQLLWKYKTGGPILLSPAYKDGVVYFAANDNYAYALRADTGALVWKSGKLPSDGYASYWPVIYSNSTTGQDYIIFSGSYPYRHDAQPGTRSILCNSYFPDDPNRYPCDSNRFNGDELFADGREILAPVVQINEKWAEGRTIVDYSRVTEYLEDNPDSDPYLHKPWRRLYTILNASDGREYTFDSDQDGYGEYTPVFPFMTQAGPAYPPVIGKDGLLYFSNMLEKDGQGQVMGWRMGTPYFALTGLGGASDEPQAQSSGGALIYRSICCDRVGDWVATDNQDEKGFLWHYIYSLTNLAPGYDQMWWFFDTGMDRLHGNYAGVNGIYHNHGDQNPIIPYQGRLFVHRSNAVIAFGPGPAQGMKPLLEANPVPAPVSHPGLDQMKATLESEVNKILAAGHLRPGYYNAGQFNGPYSELADYFANPGDTLLALSNAYPHLSAQIQQQLKDYLKREFRTYFDPAMLADIGWANGAAREAMPLPPEVQADLVNKPAQDAAGPAWTWRYPQNNFYALWKYAQVVPEDALRSYQLASSKLEVPVPDRANSEYFARRPWELNGYIAGYTGFLNLQELVGKNTEHSALRMTVEEELSRLLDLRAATFSKDTYYTDGSKDAGYAMRTLNVSRNFIMLTPELGDYLNQNALDKVQDAMLEYNRVGPYWFVSRYNASIAESAMQNLYDVPAMFLAKAYILKESRQELIKYLDAPAFERGDLFYIQNLVAAIEAPSPVQSASPDSCSQQ